MRNPYHEQSLNPKPCKSQLEAPNLQTAVHPKTPLAPKAPKPRWHRLAPLDPEPAKTTKPWIGLGFGVRGLLGLAGRRVEGSFFWGWGISVF